MQWTQRGAKGDLPSHQQYIFNIGVWASQTLSVFLGGDPDETVSSRCGKASRANVFLVKNVAEPFINFLFSDPKHCEDAIELDEGMKQIWDWSKGDSNE